MYKKYSKVLLEEAVQKSKSYLDVLRELSIPLTGDRHRYIKSRVVHFNIDTSHFTGKANSGLKE